MASVTHIILIDSNVRRRASISHSLGNIGIHVEPLESLEELAASWPRQGVIMLHDENARVKEAVRCMAKHGEWFPIIAFGEQPDANAVVNAIMDGAIDYIEWPVTPADLPVRIDQALTRAQTIGGVRHREALARARIERLSGREREVLGGMAKGLSNRMIGERLSISPRTVEIHRANMLAKLGASHTSEAIRVAIEASMPG